MDKKLILVIGPESSGNNVTTLILSQMGCYGVTKYERVNISNFIDEKSLDISNAGDKPIVIMRSLPKRELHQYNHDNISKIKNVFSKHKYKMFTIIPVRNWAANILSNYRIESIEESQELLMNSWVWLGERLKILKPFYFFNTSFLFKYPDIAIKELEIFTGLTWKGDSKFCEIRDPDKARHITFMEHGLKIVDDDSIRKMDNWKWRRIK